MKLLQTISLIAILLFTNQINAQDHTDSTENMVLPDSMDLKIKELLDLSGSTKRFNKTIDITFDAYIKQFNSDSNFVNMMNEMRVEMKKVGMKDLYKELSKVYKKHYSYQEIDGIINFYKSDIGQTLLKKQPLIYKDSVEVGMSWGRKLGEKIVARKKALENNDN